MFQDPIARMNWAVGRSPGENQLALEDTLHELIENSYKEARYRLGLPDAQPDTRAEALRQIEADFRTGNSSLESWSALYFRYHCAMDFSVEELSTAANVVPQQFRRHIKQALAWLAQKLQRKAIEVQKKTGAGHQHLPLPEFTQLIGVQTYLDRLVQSFSSPDGASLVSLEGIGGIGKTALARAFVASTEVAAAWQKILWVSARQNILADDGRLASESGSANTLEDISSRLLEQAGLAHLAGKPLAECLESLQTAFLREKMLVVVDNLETAQEYRQLIPAFAKIAGQSRFLITSRQSLQEFPYVQCISLSELDFQRAYDLIRVEIARRGHRVTLSQAHFGELISVIGGLPLALKLVAAQLKLRPFQEILDGFRRASAGVDGLYRYLYWQTWQVLNDPARRLLLSFLSADPEGEDIDFLRLMSGQANEEFLAALRELDQFSLLEIGGSVERTLYRLHRLTVTFLQTDILKLW